MEQLETQLRVLQGERSALDEVAHGSDRTPLERATVIIRRLAAEVEVLKAQARQADTESKTRVAGLQAAVDTVCLLFGQLKSVDLSLLLQYIREHSALVDRVEAYVLLYAKCFALLLLC